MEILKDKALINLTTEAVIRDNLEIINKKGKLK